MPDVAGSEEVKELKTEIQTELKDLKQDIKSGSEETKWHERLSGLENRLSQLATMHSESMAQHQSHHGALAGLEKTVQEIRSLISGLSAQHLAEEVEETTEPETEELPPPVTIIEAPKPEAGAKADDKNGLRWI